MRGAKSARPRAPNTRIDNIILESLTLEEKREERKAKLHAEFQFRGPRKADSYPVSSPVFRTILVFLQVLIWRRTNHHPLPIVFIKENDSKNRDFREKKFCKGSMNSYFFSWGNPRSRPDLVYLTEMIKKMRFKKSKNASKKIFCCCCCC